MHSLAKWKRYALQKYHFEIGDGLYADMNAIRSEEKLSNVHSFYVDQWDWEKHIDQKQRTMRYLETTVRKIYNSIKMMEQKLVKLYPSLRIKLPKEIFFIDSQELENMYPNVEPERRETLLAKEKKAIFIKKVGHKLESGVVHSNRAPDYDDWTLNGDLIVYHPILKKAIELSSMGIRVDGAALVLQSRKTMEKLKKQSKFHQGLIEQSLPFSIGGGIGQSRLCMFLLEKAHIGEVQASYWSEKEKKAVKAKGIKLL